MTTPLSEKKKLETAAVIDIGSNSIRMLLAEFEPDGKIHILEQTKKGVRLGHDTFVTGQLSQQTMNASIAILRDYSKILETYQVKHLHVVATSAVREADNCDVFLDRISMAVDMDVDLIDPPEESRLTLSAVQNAVGDALDIEGKEVLFVEVGGGSTILTVMNNGEIIASESFDLGSIRLFEMMATGHEAPGKIASLVQHRVENSMAMIKKTFPLEKVDRFVAIGGDVRFTAYQIGKPIHRSRLYSVESKEFEKLVNLCSGKTTENLARTFGLPFSDAETIVPALITYQALLRATKAKDLIIPKVSMRDGLLFDLVQDVTGQEDTERAKSILQSAKTIGEKYLFDPKHADHVAQLALCIFDELKKDHRLTGRQRILLRVAATLHEVGCFISNRNHHKHSYYLISQAEIFGLRREELEVVAQIARYHRRAVPKSSHLEYMVLSRENRIVVNKLSAILRVADALDRGHAQQISDMAFQTKGNELIIYIKKAADLTIERRAIEEKGDMFENVFGLKIRLEEAPFSKADESQSEPHEAYH